MSDSTAGIVEGGGLFDRRFTEQAAVNNERRRQLAFEEEVVKKILHAANAPFHLASARKDAARMNKDHFLSLAWFNDRYPKFPVRLGASKLSMVHSITVADLFGSRFTKTRFFREYAEFVTNEAIDDTRELAALVFNWPEIGTAVLHNCPVEQHNAPDPDSRRERNTRIVRPFGNPMVIYVVERLVDFMDNVGSNWALDD